MSRYRIESTKQGIEIVVGWDTPLRSLFAQVSDCTIADDEADPMLLWEDFGSIDALASAIAPWATLPDDVRKILEDTAKETQAYVYQVAEKAETELLGTITAAGVKSNVPNKDAFVAASKPVYDEFAREVAGSQAVIDKAIALGK